MKRLLFSLLAAATSTRFTSNAFLLPAQQRCIPHSSIVEHRQHRVLQPNERDVSVNLFGDLFKKLRRDKENDGDGNGDATNASLNAESPSSDALNASADSDDASATATVGTQSNDIITPPQPEPEPEETAEAKAQKLLAQAARIRLEAEKNQVELTLNKISKLDQKLAKIKSSSNSDNTDGNVDDAAREKEKKELEEALAVLKSQLVTDEKTGEVTFVPTVPSTPIPSNTTSKRDIKSEIELASSVPFDQKLNTQDSIPSTDFISEEKLEQLSLQFNKSPPYLRILLAKIAGFGGDVETISNLNATAIIRQLYQDEHQISSQKSFISTNTSDARALIERAYEKSSDMTYYPSQEEIDEKVQQLGNLPGFVKRGVMGSMNDTEIAVDLLIEEWKSGKKSRERSMKRGRSIFNVFGRDVPEDDTSGRDEIGMDGEKLKDSGTFNRMFGEDESTSRNSMSDDVSLLMESTFPSSTRKEGQTPTLKEVNAFVENVLGVVDKGFVMEGDPVAIPGGWIIRGKNECKNGNELIDKLDKRTANVASLRDNISYYLIKDPYPPSQDDFIADPLNWPQVLFVTGSDIARDPRPVVGTLISALAISTTWYASIYPFLTNTKLFDRAEEAMNLADAGMQVDLSWLSDESIPLFFSFMALQLLHETAHIAVAKTKNFEVTVPTLIPSVISGITGSITSLKTSPKNKSDLLLFSVAGPLTGILGSLLLEAYGLTLTASANVQSLQSYPGLPLALLRSSSLGGGLVDLILGNGVLNVPSSIEGANMLASTIIPLHPFAIAGFVSLLVNALALVPAGRTDGGRISMSLFGRSGSQGLTLVSLAALFIVGFSGSDLMLFYFGFVVLGQLELEIPLRNEIDDVGLVGVLLAAVAGFLTVLTLAPM